MVTLLKTDRVLKWLSLPVSYVHQANYPAKYLSAALSLYLPQLNSLLSKQQETLAWAVSYLDCSGILYCDIFAVKVYQASPLIFLDSGMI